MYLRQRENLVPKVFDLDLLHEKDTSKVDVFHVIGSAQIARVDHFSITVE